MDNKCVIFSNLDRIEFQEDTQTEWRHKWELDVMYYDIISPCRTMEMKKVKKALNLAMTTWDLEIPVKFKSNWNNYRNPTSNITMTLRLAMKTITLRTGHQFLHTLISQGRETYQAR